MAKNLYPHFIPHEEGDEPFDIDDHIKTLSVTPRPSKQRDVTPPQSLPENEFDWERDLPQTD